MFISVQELQLKPIRFQVDIPAEEIDYGGDISQASRLHAEGKAQLLSHSLGEIRIEGKLNVKMQATCDRCLEMTSFSVDNEFDLVYMPDGEGRIGGEDEVDQAAIEVGFYQGNGMALNDVLREVVLLALPMQLVCREACKGICPVCGENRNERDCGCAVRAEDDRWNKLKEFRAEIGPRN